MSKVRKGNWYLSLSSFNPFGACYRRVGQSHSFKEEKRGVYGTAPTGSGSGGPGHFRRTVSESHYAPSPHEGSTGPQHPAGRGMEPTHHPGNGSPNWARNKYVYHTLNSSNL